MIEINLLPGGGKRRKAGGGAGVGTQLKELGARIKDPLLIAAVASVVLVVAIIGLLFTSQQREATRLADRETKAVAESTRYAAVIKELRKVRSQRDSVLRTLNVIASIDNDRYLWPHLLDEISRALPPYTWLTSLTQTSAVPAPAAAVADSAKAEAPEVLRFRLVGNTVDIQALTRFMKLLEASPWIQNVQLARSELVVVDNKEVTEFQLDCDLQRPDSSAIKTVPVTLSTR